MNYFLYIVYKIFKLKVKLFPQWTFKYPLQIWAKVLQTIDKRHVKVIESNLDYIYGDKITTEEKTNIVNSVYRNLFYNVYEFIANSFIKKEELQYKLLNKVKKVNNKEYLEEVIQQNRPIIILTAHYGNWELISNYLITITGKNMTVIGKKLNNNYLNQELFETREIHGAKMLEKNSAAKGMFKTLKNNEMLGLLIDQNVSEKSGDKCIFLGKEVYQNNSVSRLVEKTNAIILPMFVKIKDFGEYEVDYYKPIDIETIEGEDKTQKVSQEIADTYSKAINEDPTQWFWLHKRFKALNPGLYKRK